MARFDTDALRRTHLLSDYLPARGVALKRDGLEWVACCPFHAENTPSFSVYPGKNSAQQFHCFGCGANGDIIDFVQQWDGVGFSEACEILGGKREAGNERKSASSNGASINDPYKDWTPKTIPEHAHVFEVGKPSGPLFNPKRDDEGKGVTQYSKIGSVHPYCRMDGKPRAYVLRIDLPEGRKITPIIMWCRNSVDGREGWCHFPMRDSGRPIYRLPELARLDKAQVLIFCGERKTDKAAEVLTSHACVSFAGGDGAASKTDWTPLKDRDVVVWPDNDAEGDKAADTILSAAREAGARSLRVIRRPGDEKPKGWDIADGLAEGWTRADVVAWAKARATPWKPREKQPEPEPAGASDDAMGRAPANPPRELRPTQQEKPHAEPKRKPQPEAEPGTNVVKLPGAKVDTSKWQKRHWKSYLELKDDGSVKPRLMTNYVAMLTHHPDMEGVLAKNLFTQDVMVQKRPPWAVDDWRPSKLTDADVVRAMSWLERVGMTPKKNDVGSAIDVVAEEYAFDPIKDYFNALEWDGRDRLETWLITHMGVSTTKTGIERIFGMRWMIAAAARNLSTKPEGEKVDTMLVFEGAQGKRKSSALGTLATINGVRYFSDSVNEITGKDAALQMARAIIVELPEMDAFDRVTDKAAKAWASRQVDSFRPPYGRHVIDLPRRSVIAGTINPAGRGYLKDPTGARRYWPVYVGGEIRSDLIERDRDQLWAEAVHLYRAGEQWWLQDREDSGAVIEQAKRFSADAWNERIAEYVHVHEGFITMEKIYKNAIEVPPHLRNDTTDRRVANCLTQLGYRRARADLGGRIAIIYVKEGMTDDEIQSQYAAHGA